MRAKSELFSRLQHLDNAIDNEVLVDNGIAPSDHNGAANLLRKGLGIVAFNILEDFIKNKASETLNHISNSGISFSSLSDKLQYASTFEALNALAFRARLEKKDGGDWQSLIQEETIKIHSTKTDNFELSKYSLVSSNSNISGAEVGELLAVFSITGGWRKLKQVSDSINGGVTDLSQSYNNAAERRHNAAHAAEFRYEYGWLNEIKREILAISASLDILLTARCRQVDGNTIKDLADHIIEEALQFRFLKPSGEIYRELTSLAPGQRSRKNWQSLDQAVAQLRPSLVEKKEFLIVLDTSGSMKDWYV